MSLRRTTARGYLVLQKHSQHLNGLKCAIGHIRQFQAEVIFGLDEPKSKGLFFIAHDFGLFLNFRLLPFFFWSAKVSMSPGWHSSTRHIFSRVSRFIPKALPFFKRHNVVWLMPVCFANQLKVRPCSAKISSTRISIIRCALLRSLLFIASGT